MMPKQLRGALDRPTLDTDGQALATPAVATADEFESAESQLLNPPTVLNRLEMER